MASQPGVSSPCINVCEIDTRTGWCRGCRRTLAEIADWACCSDATKRAILARLPQRVSSGRTVLPRKDAR